MAQPKRTEVLECKLYGLNILRVGCLDYCKLYIPQYDEGKDIKFCEYIGEKCIVEIPKGITKITDVRYECLRDCYAGVDFVKPSELDGANNAFPSWDEAIDDSKKKKSSGVDELVEKSMERAKKRAKKRAKRKTERKKPKKPFDFWR